VTLVQVEQHQSLYYSNSDRLKTDGKNAYAYDDAGNVVKKGNRFTISGDSVTFTTAGEGVEYWTYKYDLLNRLIQVKKNGTIVAEYEYDPEGLRVVKKAHGETVHYVFEGLEPIYTRNVTTGKVKSYVFAGSQLISRVDGVIGDTTAKKYWYHTDHVGSVKAVTNQAGAVVWDGDYLPFGTQYLKKKLDPSFEEDDLGFAGKGYDADTGFYYFNARWYDSETGRFISEDPVADPNNPNLYSYCANNPLRFTDPTGLDIGSPGDVGNPGNIGYDNGGSSVVPCPVKGGSGSGTGGSGTDNKPKTTAEIAKEIQRDNPHVSVEVNEQNQIIITANAQFFDTVSIDSLGLEISGDQITLSIETGTDKDGVGYVSYDISVSDQISDTGVNPASSKDNATTRTKITTNDGKKVGEEGNGAGIEGSRTTDNVRMHVKITKRSDGTVTIQGSIGRENLSTDFYAHFEDQNAPFPEWSKDNTPRIEMTARFWAKFNTKSNQSPMPIFQCGATVYQPEYIAHINDRTYIQVSF